MPPFLHRHFERKREIFFVRGQAKVVREAGNGKHRMLHVTGDHGASCRWIYEGKQQTANEKDPSAALGMTKRGADGFSLVFRSLPSIRFLQCVPLQRFLARARNDDTGVSPLIPSH